MKKVVVVVDKDHKEMFEASEGNNLELIENRGSATMGAYVAGYLSIKEGDVTLASFTTWMYWRLLE